MLLKLQLRRVLDRHDAFAFRYVCRHDVEQGCLPGAGSARDQNVELALDDRLQQIEHRFGQGLIVKQILGGERIPTEAPNGKHWAVEGQGRNDRVDA